VDSAIRIRRLIVSYSGRGGSYERNLAALLGSSRELAGNVSRGNEVHSARVNDYGRLRWESDFLSEEPERIARGHDDVTERELTTGGALRP
jgi:hypothetical protein